MIILLTTQNCWKTYQIHIKSEFLNGVLEEKVCVEQPPDYDKQGEEDKVYRLKKGFI